jgi:methylmalonyl-CoA mutase N-terminal domain/subunit
MGDRMKQLREEWEREMREVYEEKLRFSPPEHKNESGISLKYVYDEDDLSGIPPEMPGQYPYTRGIRALGYQYAPWMIQMLHGYGTSDETRGRTEFLLKEGMRGYGEDNPVILIEVDAPTTVGLDPDDPLAFGAVGLGGPSVTTLEDLDRLLGGYDLSKTRFAPNTRFTCLPMLALYVVFAERRGYKPEQLMGQSQNDALTRWLTTDIGGPAPRTQQKLRVELIKYATEHIPKWNHTNLSGYHYGEMCATPAQQLGIVMSQAVELIRDCVKAGLNPDQFIPRFSSQIHMGMSFFEEIAKLRAWRRLWAKTMRERFGCKSARSLQYRMHIHTGGSSMTTEQPLNNIVRATLQVLASVLGGTQSLHTCSYDEAVGLPSEEAVRTAIRVNQIMRHETGIPAVSDPLGGSYYLEALTGGIEEEATKMMNIIEGRGGFCKSVEDGFLRHLLKDHVIRWREDLDAGQKIVVGVNRFKSDVPTEIPCFATDAGKASQVAVERIREWRRSRNEDESKRALAKVEQAMRSYDDIEKAGILMPVLISAARAHCTLGEMMGAIYRADGGRVQAADYGKL